MSRLYAPVCYCVGRLVSFLSKVGCLRTCDAIDGHMYLGTCILRRAPTSRNPARQRATIRVAYQALNLLVFQYFGSHASRSWLGAAIIPDNPTINIATHTEQWSSQC